MDFYQCTKNEDLSCDYVLEDPQLKKVTFKYPCLNISECEPNRVILKRGYYQFELWGAQGGDARNYTNLAGLTGDTGGKGAYVSGNIALHQLTVLFFYIGGQGENQSSTQLNVLSHGGYNGGGDGGIDTGDDNIPESGAGGGGSTDIRLIGGNFDNLHSLKSRIIVAGAGGGAVSTSGRVCQYTTETENDLLCSYKGEITSQNKAGAAGTIHGYRTTTVTFPGNQTEGLFGKGQTGLSLNNILPSSMGGSIGGGGSGYFGGTSITEIDKNILYEAAGAGGSSYVSGYNGCRSVKETPYDGVETTDNPVHYSGIRFYNIIMKSGIESFKSPDGDEEIGHSGSGAIAITYLKPIPALKTCINSKRFENYILVLICSSLNMLK